MLPVGCINTDLFPFNRFIKNIKYFEGKYLYAEKKLLNVEKSWLITSRCAPLKWFLHLNFVLQRFYAILCSNTNLYKYAHTCIIDRFVKNVCYF